MNYSLMTTSLIFPLFGKLNLGISKAAVWAEYTQMLCSIAEIGIPAVEVTSLELDLWGVQAVAAALKQAGLSVSGIIHMDQFGDADLGKTPEITEKACARVHDAVQLGTKSLMLAMRAQSNVEQYSRSQLQEALIRNITPAAALGFESGIAVSVEDTPHAVLPVCDSHDILELTQAVPGLSLTYDTGNMLIKNEKPLDFYSRCKHLVTHVHLKDMMYTTDGNGDLTTDKRRIAAVRHGYGAIDFSAILSALTADCYCGPLVIEYVGSGDHLAQIRNAMQYLDSLSCSGYTPMANCEAASCGILRDFHRNTP